MISSFYAHRVILTTLFLTAPFLTAPFSKAFVVTL